MASEQPDLVNTPRRPPRRPNRNKIYAYPLPVTIYPLPTFIPHNPLTLFPIIYHVISQSLFPPSSTPTPSLTGFFSAKTASVHITDSKAIRFLWERGFFGKGSLSRSEPSWLDRENVRRGRGEEKTSEDVTKKRREERRAFKQDRERRRQEAIEELLQKENKPLQQNGHSRAGNGFVHSPKSHVDDVAVAVADGDVSPVFVQLKPSVEEMGLAIHSSDEAYPGPPKLHLISRLSDIGSPAKSVRFSPDVEVAEFVLPPSRMKVPPPRSNDSSPRRVPSQKEVIRNEEHLQLSLQEAFFLAYGIDALQILNPDTQLPFDNGTLLRLFRRHSYFPPQVDFRARPDDPFMLSYVVYHHFRSLGWVVRDGIKFGADLLLYDRGPVFSHAEFAVTIIPSYSDPYYQTEDIQSKSRRKKPPAWWQLHSTNRVQTHVHKSLIMVYVDVPPPCFGDNDLPVELTERIDITAVLQRYKVKEFHLKRWSMNRSRD